MVGAGGPGGFMPPKHVVAEKNKEPLPKNIKEVPGFIKRVIASFFTRLFYILKLVWETSPWILIFMVAVSLIEGLLPVAGTYISAQIINVLAQNSTAEQVMLSTIGVLFLLQFGYLFLNRITKDINRVVSSLAGELVTNHIRRKIMKKAKEIDIACFDLPDFYEELENANREAGMRPVQILNSTLNIISVLISLVSFIAILFNISGWAPLIVTVFALPSAIVSFAYRKKTVGYMRLRSKSRRQMNYFSSALVDKDLVKEIRLLGLNDDFEKRYDSVFADYFKGLKKIILSEGIWSTVLGLLRIFASCFLFYFVAKLVLDQQIRVGDYSLYTGALSSIGTSVSTFISGTSTIYEGTLFIDNLIRFMNQKNKIVQIGEHKEIKKGIGHKIVFEHVYFRYPGCEKDVIKDLNITFDPGKTVALVGLNGAGKTTIIKLLTRLYDPTAGRILLDGEDIRSYDTKELYGLFGIVFQDFGRYAVSVKENIAFGNIDEKMDDNKIEEASVMSNSYEYIERLPKKFDTPLMRYFEEDGLELSVGQWQKLAVARAFYGNSDILILDEPTASLDALAEQEIFRQFDKLREGKTTLFVSHRLSSAVEADHIIVIKYGELIEEGNHASLMKQGGEYAKMFLAQAEKYRKNE